MSQRSHRYRSVAVQMQHQVQPNWVNGAGEWGVPREREYHAHRECEYRAQRERDTIRFVQQAIESEPTEHLRQLSVVLLTARMVGVMRHLDTIQAINEGGSEDTRFASIKSVPHLQPMQRKLEHMSVESLIHIESMIQNEIVCRTSRDHGKRGSMEVDDWQESGWYR